MKIRSDFVTNSSSSSFTLEIMIEGVDGSVKRFEGEGYGDEEMVGVFPRISSYLSPKEMGTSASLDQLLLLLYDDVIVENNDGEEEKLFDDQHFFIKSIREYDDINNIASIQIYGREDYAGGESYAQYYSYDRTTNQYRCQEEGEGYGAINGSSGGSMFVRDYRDAKEDETLKNIFKELRKKSKKRRKK